MKIVGITWAKNEADIIECFIRHNLTILDELFVVDDCSSDATLNILAALQSEGLALHVESRNIVGRDLSDRMTTLLYRAVERSDAEWFIPLDADELLLLAKREMFTLLTDSFSPVYLNWQTYVPTKTDATVELNPVCRITHKLAYERHGFGDCRVVIPRELLTSHEVTVAPGNHFIGVDGRPVAGGPVIAGAIAHFPVRSVDQLNSKVILAGLQCIATGKWPKDNYRYFELYEQLRTNRDQFRDDFYLSAIRYEDKPGSTHSREIVNSPIAYNGGPLCYTPATQTRDATAALLAYLEQLAVQVSSLAVQATESMLSDVMATSATMADLLAQLRIVRTSVLRLNEQLRDISIRRTGDQRRHQLRS